ncbi:MAG: hypothetical protein HYX29_03915 [Solirubrobacterales bacterium]|nr:hypothetical protein [Solirubrobacterales bacterium]
MKKLVPFLAIAACLALTSGASADVIPSLSTSLTNGRTDYNASVLPDGIDSSQEIPATRLGGHADFNVDMRFNYGATGLTSAGVEDPATYPAGTDYRETAKNVVVDIPPGLLGNPNAVPFAERCDQATFQTGTCPESATVGEIWVKYSIMDFFASIGQPNALSLLAVGPKTRTGYVNTDSGYTTVSLLKTDPEVPAQIGLYVRGPIGYLPLRIKLEINPVTSEDLRLRAITVGGIPNKVSVREVDENDNIITVARDYRLERMKLKLYGKLANGNAFMTSPTSCQPWTSTAWSNATYSNTNATPPPLPGAGPTPYVGPERSTILPDCSNAASVPFPASGNVSISSPDRDTSPAFDFTISNPGVQALDDNVSTSPRKIVTTIPASLNVDVQQLGRTCQLADFNADACAASTRVGSVQIETPLIKAGLTGDVYLVKRNATSGLPDLGLRVRGAITFTQLGSNRYIGARNNQIETTFDDIPQVGFSKLIFHLDGGTNGLLRSLACPTYNKAPALPNFTYSFTAWSGATASSSMPLNMKNCFGIQELKKYPRCLYKKLPIHPNYQSRSRLKIVSLKIDKRRKGSAKKRPFRFDVPIKKLKRGRHSFELTATYDDGTVSRKTATFKKC